MPDRSFPLALSVLGNVRLGADEYAEQRVITDLVQQGLKADQDRTGWLNRQQALTKLRFGIRRLKTFPWKHASNLSIPLIDAQIRKYKPILMRLLVQPDPVVEFSGENPDAIEGERLAEAEYNWLFKTKMEALEPMAYIIDSMCHRGFGIAQVGWDYQREYETRVIEVAPLFPKGLPPDDQVIAAAFISEYDLDPRDPRTATAIARAVDDVKAGKPTVKIGFMRVVVDRPAIWDRDPVQVIVPPRTVDYGNAERVIVQHVFTVRRLQQLEADGFFTPGSVAKILDAQQKRDTGRYAGDVSASQGLYNDRATQDEHERIWGVEDEDNILIWEVYHWFDYDGDGLADRVVTFVHPKSRTKLSCRPYPYPFHCWPFVKFDYEKTSRRFHSPRGISSMLDGLQREVNARHNGRLDAMTLRNAPIYQIPLLAGFKARNMRAVPGTVLQLPLGSRLEPVAQDRGSWPEEMNEENFLRQIAEGYIGSFDQAITAQGGARTATEINATVQLAASTVSFDATLFQLAMKKLHTLIWELWLDLRPQEVSIKVRSDDPAATGPSLRTVKKHEIDKRFTLTPTGSIANTNHALELANSREALQFFANDSTGTVDPWELRRWYFELLDARVARRIMKSPQDARERQILMQAASTLEADPSLLAQMKGSVRPDQRNFQQTEIAEPPTP